MKFYNIDINLDPKITGRRNGNYFKEGKHKKKNKH